MKVVITVRELVYPKPFSEDPEKRTYEKIRIDADGSIDDILKILEKTSKSFNNSK